MLLVPGLRAVEGEGAGGRGRRRRRGASARRMAWVGYAGGVPGGERWAIAPRGADGPPCRGGAGGTRRRGEGAGGDAHARRVSRLERIHRERGWRHRRQRCRRGCPAPIHQTPACAAAGPRPSRRKTGRPARGRTVRPAHGRTGRPACGKTGRPAQRPPFPPRSWPLPSASMKLADHSLPVDSLPFLGNHLMLVDPASFPIRGA